MLSLDSQQWSELDHAYGSAENVPKWLRGLESGNRKGALDEIWSALCHQYSVYSASVAAVPHIVRIAQKANGAFQIQLLGFVGTVAAWINPEEIEVDSTIQESYDAAVPTAGSLVFDCLTAGRHDFETTVYLLESLAALKGCIGLGRILEGFVNKEFTPICPSCDRELYVWPSDSGLSTAAEDPVFHKQTPRTDVEPAQLCGSWNGIDFDCAHSLSWLSHLSKQAGQDKLADYLRYLFGFVTCPACKHRFNLLNRLTELA